MRYCIHPVALFMIFFSFVAGGLAAQELTLVRVQSGFLEGSWEAKGKVRAFKGIPYAAPPVGALRWRAPQPVRSWRGVRPSKEFGPSPMQAVPAPFMYWSSEFLIPPKPISEDCLYLNVWTGAEGPGEDRPVIVYIYGGGFQSGGSACPIYDGTAMARKGVVFVTFNYRVGVFGFLAHPELSDEASYGTSGNYALLDMIAALKWVRENIRAFGGDPDNVTIAGQSAGAFAVNYLTASPLAEGLFHRAIAQSGGNFYTNPSRPAPTLASAERMGEAFARSLGATDLASLRALSAELVMEGQGGLTFPLVDGYVVPQSIYETFAGGRQNDVPTIVGWNADDAVSMGETPAEAFRAQVEERLGDRAEEFFRLYPADSAAAARRAQIEMSRDETFAIQNYTWAKMQSLSGEAPIYVYNFNRPLPAHSPETEFGAFHSGEVVYAYDNLPTLDRPWEAADRELADAMSDYWVNFARTGDPNGQELPYWPAYDPNEEKVIILDEVIRAQPLPNLPKLRFWESYYTAKD